MRAVVVLALVAAGMAGGVEAQADRTCTLAVASRVIRI
jgi:hypothetical protein